MLQQQPACFCLCLGVVLIVHSIAYRMMQQRVVKFSCQGLLLALEAE
jgi:hypothetical protein